tara:strand:- start:847 stop:1026 length:180 start_codon:yes stop_codon:yes gene_type:complete
MEIDMIDSISNADALILFVKIKEDKNVLKYLVGIFNNLARNWQDKLGFFFIRKGVIIIS